MQLHSWLWSRHPCCAHLSSLIRFSLSPRETLSTIFVPSDEFTHASKARNSLILGTIGGEEESVRSNIERERKSFLNMRHTPVTEPLSFFPSDGIYYPLPNDLIILSPFRKKGGKERWMEHDCFFEYRFVTKIWRLKYLTFDRIRELEFSRKNGLEASLVSIGSKVKVTLRL